jgi:tetratricopeptide (TPR) repeat protein
VSSGKVVVSYAKNCFFLYLRYNGVMNPIHTTLAPLKRQALSLLLIFLAGVILGNILFASMRGNSTVGEDKDTTGALLSVSEDGEENEIGDATTTSPTTTAEPFTGAQVKVDTLPSLSTVPQPVPSITGTLSFPGRFSDTERATMSEQITATRLTLATNPAQYEQWLVLGILYKNIDNFVLAQQAWDYATRLRPTDARAYNNLGNLFHFYLKDFPKSEHAYRNSIAHDPANILAYKGLFELYALSFQQNTNKAVQTLEEGLASNPNNLDLITSLANYYRDRGDVARAESSFERALAVARSAGDTNLVQLFEDELQKLRSR